jgi:hypothetical protein
MDNLWIFGDSFSCPYSNSECQHWGIPYTNYKGYTPKIFSHLVSENLNLNHVNHAKGGTDNYTIFETICDNVDNITSNDLIIVGWSNPSRFRIIVESNSWETIIPNFFNKEFDINEIDCLAAQCVYRNESPQPLFEIYKWMKLLKKMFGKRIVFWSPFLTEKADIICPNDFIKVSSIKADTNGLIDDCHYDELTHKNLAKLLLDFYNKIHNIKKIL